MMRSTIANQIALLFRLDTAPSARIYSYRLPTHVGKGSRQFCPRVHIGYRARTHTYAGVVVSNSAMYAFQLCAGNYITTIGPDAASRTKAIEACIDAAIAEDTGDTDTEHAFSDLFGLYSTLGAADCDDMGAGEKLVPVTRRRPFKQWRALAIVA